MTIKFDDKVVIVTGAGGGLGKSHALEFARRGAKVVVNDLGGSVDGSGGASDAANAVVEEIKAEGGEAIANGASVADQSGVQNMIDEVMSKWGRIDVLVNNAGILRDKSFHKISLEEFNAVMDVHFQGSVYTSHAVYPIMREQNFGRIIFTTSSGGLSGNFGQANYGAAKMAMIGLMNCLKIEGQKYNVHSSAVAPVALSRMTENLFPEGIGERFLPEYVTPAVIYLASDDAPNGAIIGAGAGVFTQFRIFETMGLALGTGDDMTPENIAAGWSSVADMDDARELFSGPEQTIKILEQADKA
ncbi:MAG: SDR family NAD(P)-dependent oxidoreductase [Gammaproteobacteria bacterium]|jgi:NAD(P)-dependent dehydrogenase (short-subunit alcohol dehydrogenase family)|nr:MAG: 3-oxoacyl-ACP reductase [Gammaproteobacteria bacterium]